MNLHWLRIFKPNDPLRLTGNVLDQNRVHNILNDLSGVNCRIVKPTNADGLGWQIVFDGTSDVNPDDLDIDPIGGDVNGINKTFLFESDGSSYDETLDDKRDYRGRIIESLINIVPDTDSATPGSQYIIVSSLPSADVDLAADSPYTLYVESTDGSLHVRASAAADQAMAWVRASANTKTPETCPLPAGTPTFPLAGLVQQYDISNNATSGEADGAAICWRGDYAGPPSATWLEYRIKGGTITVTYTNGTPQTCYWSVADGLEYRDNTTYPTWSSAAQNPLHTGKSQTPA